MKNLGFVFPGQGSQKVGMLADLASSFSLVEETFSEASAALGEDLWQIVQLDAQQKLNQTDITQPALLAASVAIWRVWQSLDGPQAAILAGHSLGEYSALVCSGVLPFADARAHSCTAAIAPPTIWQMVVASSAPTRPGIHNRQ